MQVVWDAYQEIPAPTSCSSAQPTWQGNGCQSWLELWKACLQKVHSSWRNWRDFDIYLSNLEIILIKSGDIPYFSKIYCAFPLGLWFRVTLACSNKAMGVIIWILTSESCWSKALESDGCCRCTWHHSPPHLCYEYPHWRLQVYLKYIYCKSH